MNDPDWVKTISQLKNFDWNSEYDYTIIYKQDKQRNDRSFSFDSVKFVDETNSYIFCSHMTDFHTGELTDEIRNRLVLIDTDIISLKSAKKFKASDYFFMG